MNSFAESGLSGELLQAIKELGFENPMPVQAEVIPFLLGEGGDLIALAQTGTGKTAAFGLPLLEKIDISENLPQTLILSPTRELCMQIASDLKDYAHYLGGLRVLPVYGGASIKFQMDELKKGAQIVVATPGRLLDLIKRKAVKLSQVRTVVMDEADEMLNMGFLDDIDSILASVPEGHNTLLFSATMPDEIARLSMKYMHNPKEIVVGGRNEGTSSVRHIYYTVPASKKYRTLKRIVDYYPRIYGIIFCRTKIETQEISDKLIKDGYNVDALHGDLSQAQRDNVMQRFRLHNIQILVATDVAARGIDVDDLTHVINYSIPDEKETYTHRSGRTGRAGKKGISISIVNMRERKHIREIEKALKQTFEVGRIPTGKEICSKQIFNLVDKLENVDVNEEELGDTLSAVYNKLEWLEKEEIIKRLVSLEFHRFLQYYRDDEDFDADEEEKPERKLFIQREQGYTKLFINVGRMDGIDPKDLLGMVNSCMKRKVEVGRIDLFTRYTLFDVKDDCAEELMEQLNTLKLRGRPVRANPASDEQIERGSKIKSKPQNFRRERSKKKFRK